MNLVLDYVDKFNNVSSKNKHRLTNDLRSNGKFVILDRMAVSYIRQPHKYEEKPEILKYLVDIKNKYDKSCNIISLTSALYEGGKGNFENEHEKIFNAKKDIVGVSDFFEYAQDDERFLRKNLNKAVNVFVYDSSVIWRNKTYPLIVKKTYELYKKILRYGSSALNVLLCINELTYFINENDLIVGEPLCQYCILLLTQYENAKKLFKVKGLENKSDEKLSKLIHNSYADLRVISYVNFIKSKILKSNFEVVFETHDEALKIYIDEFDITRNWSAMNEKMESISSYSISLKFELYNNQVIFDEESFKVFKFIIENRR